MSKFSLALKEAQSGDCSSMVYVAMSYAKGINVEKDLDKRNYWLERAEQCDVPEVLALLGELYDEGRFVEENKERAVDLYMRALSGDRRMGGYMLGKHYYSLYTAHHNRHDLHEAKRWWKEAESEGHFTSKIARILLDANGFFGCWRAFYARISLFCCVFTIPHLLQKEDLFFRFWKLSDLRDRFPKLYKMVSVRIDQMDKQSHCGDANRS